MFGDVTGRIFMTPTEEIENRDFPYLGPALEMSKFQLYIQFIYLSSCTMGAVMYGDIIPFAMSEQLFDFVAMMTCRMFLAFLFAEGASYLSSVHKSASQHTKKVAQIKDWSDLNQLPKVLINRIVRFYDILWKNFKGVRQQQILQDLPETLRMDVRQCLFKDIIENWEVMIGNEDHGVVSSIIQNFELRIIPQDEFIIKFGEIAQDMYFIVKGQVNCISREGIHLSQIGVGKIFGAEVLQKGSVRSSTIQAATDVSVAIMTIDDFLKICELYPGFKRRILQIVLSREQENKVQINKVTEETKINQIIEGQQPENQDENLDQNQTVSDNQEVESAPSFRVNLNASQKIEKTQTDLTELNLIIPKEKSLKPDEESKTGRKLLNSERDQGSVTSPSEFGQDHDSYTRRKSKEKKESESSDLSKSRMRKSVAQRNTRFTRVSLRAGGINEHFEIGQSRNQNQFKHKLQLCSTREFMRWSILLIAIYNIVFIPIQFGYRIKFDGLFLMMEIFTIILYGFDVKFRLTNLRLLESVGGNLPESDNFNEQAMMGDKDEYFSRVHLLKVEIGCSTIALIPFSLIFQSFKYHEPLIVVNTLCLLRIVKILPLIKLFEFLKTKNLQKWRVIEVVVIYYILCHITAGVWISMGQFVPDVRATWIRRIPVPQAAGMRQNPTLDDVTPLSVYIHALWFIANTVSHVAIGDITATTSEERVFVAIFIWFATFLYSFLFGNIVSIVSDFAPKGQMLYFEKYQYVMQRLGPMKDNKSLVSSINEYFDYIWGNEQGGSIEEQFLSDLPQCIRSDIMLCKYQEAIESSLIFKDDSGAVDVSLANSIIQLMEVRIYMTNEYVIKVGSQCSQTYVLLEGQAVLAGACRLLNGVRSPHDKDKDIIGIIKVGGHFGTDLPNEQYNYNQKSTCHMVSTQPSVLGVLSQNNLEVLYRSFPVWKQKIQSLNKYIFNKCELNLHKHQNSIKKKMQQKVLQLSPFLQNQKFSEKDYCLLYLENHLTYSNQEVYDQIIESLDQFLERQNNSIHIKNSDLVIQQKIFFYGQEGKVFPIFDSQYQKALKKASHESLIAQVLQGHDDRPNEQCEEEDLDWQEKLVRLWHKFYFKANSRPRKVIDFVHTINLLQIAIVTPLVVGFSIEMKYHLNMLESLSLIISIAWVITNFRTQAQIKGQPTLKYATLLKHYQNNGLFLDILGTIPFNIMLGQNVPKRGIIIRSLFRVIRVFSSWRAVELFRKAEVSYKNNKLNGVMQVLKAFYYIYFLGHFLACTFYFIIEEVENQSHETWIDYNELADKSLGVKYLRSIYTVFNVVCSVGYGDMFPMTDLERVVFTVMITIGDLLFALAFGLIARLTLQISLTNETKQFRDKMYQIQEFMTSFNLDHAQQRRVEQFFAYQYKQKYNSHLIDYDDLISYLPHSLREEVVYQSCKTLLTTMFKEYDSENLIRKLAVVLESTIYLPGDFILYKGDIGEEMYFIAEGSVRSLSDDKQTITRSLHKGSFFGETAILFPTKRSNFIQAETFCIIRVLKGEDFRWVAQDFPDIHKKLQERAAQNKDDSNDDDSISGKGGGIDTMKILSTNELTRFHEDHMNLKPVIEEEYKREIQVEEKRKIDPMINDVISEENSSQYTSSHMKEDSKGRIEQIQESTSRQNVDITSNIEPGDNDAQQSQGPVTKIARNSTIMINRSKQKEQRGEGENTITSQKNVDPTQINSSSEQIEEAKSLKNLASLNLGALSMAEESINSSINKGSDSKSSTLTDKKLGVIAAQHQDLQDFFSDDESIESMENPDNQAHVISANKSSNLGHDDTDQSVLTPTPTNRRFIVQNKKQFLERNSSANLDSFFSAAGEQQNLVKKNLALDKVKHSKTSLPEEKSPIISDHQPKSKGSDPNMKKYVHQVVTRQNSQNRSIKGVSFSPNKELLILKASNSKLKPSKSPSLADLFKESKNDHTCHTIRRSVTNVQHSPKKMNPEKPLKQMPVRRLSRVSLGKNLVLSSAAGLKLQWTVST